MASVLALGVFLLGAFSVSASTDLPIVAHAFAASPVPPPPLEDPGTTPTPKSPAIVLAVNTETTPAVAANTSLTLTERNAKSIRFSAVSGNEVDGGSSLSPEDELADAAEIGGLSDVAAEKETNPLSAFKGVVSECVWALSVACLQRKVLIFVNRLSRRDRFGILGDGVSLVRVWGDAPAAISEDILAERVSALSSADPVEENVPGPDEEHLLDVLTQRALDDLLYSHAIRLRLPTWFGTFPGARSISAVDIDLDDVIETGRQNKAGGIKIKIKKKKKKGGGKQMMKKMMKGMAKMGGMMMTMLLGKVAVLAPFLKIISALALKASALALLLSKILLVRSLFSSGFGGGSGLSSIFSGLKGGLGGGGGGGSTPSSGYGAPSSSYNAPSSSYSSPSSSYSSPSSSYGAPASSYNPPSTSYGTPTSSYRAPGTSFGSASSRPSSSYGVPSSSSWSSAPTAPPAAPSSSYGAPSNSYSPPSKDYGTPSGGGSSWSPAGGFSSTGVGSSAGSSAGSSGAGVGGGASSAGGSSGGYVGGGAHWANRRGWESYSVEATTESIEQYSQTN